ncbi:hypothetical protein RZS08_00445, partial [Arthrospira platensis SPKY1]|nr:hypothetical protein [Arthrospira platensis SPKY1]
ALPFSVTEDSLLLLTFHRLKKYKLLYPAEVEALVTSKACPDLKTLYRQKKRWGVGGLDTTLWGFGVMSTAFITHILILMAPFFLSAKLIYFILFKIFIDLFFLVP